MKDGCIRYEQLEKTLTRMIEAAATMVENGGGEKWQKKLEHLENAKNEIYKARYSL